MPVFSVEHTTVYRYRRPVGFGVHRLLGRPRDTAEQRLLDWSLEVSPRLGEMHHELDPFGNIVTQFSVPSRARELRVVNRLRVAQTPSVPESRRLASYAASWPFAYDADDAPDLAPLCEPALEDGETSAERWIVDGWAREVLDGAATPTIALLSRMTRAIHEEFAYCPRVEEGTQPPSRTLALRSGTCRDFAVLMIEALRGLGFAVRFVTGYLFTPPGAHHHGGGATHAWLDVFLPGLGWVDLDPTNGIVGSRDLIRVASVRDWRQAVPLAGTWIGFPSDFESMTVTVRVEEEARQAAQSLA
ncbi:transglutaminase family protein [Acidomonas methanolica]|uniref:Transglutaminase n=1 Tax=Acidomonas methanolica NBRC 104435 TaxID=1231351 RepID=A0A023D619_ACIMT|nr:transglutaminase family protein [Acidomonas methanolica]MBU2655045.1 transglutaminase family protein [Acidomonas methanolica]TCS25640.1 transglutaminase-like putative cysteine protease [Acidomonas methanolica]GAJ29236.1 transglutaminase [Acidomonas methanolica NBRC 104435]GBQ53227.1 putative cysteine protease [Acidomonas methanolica]GEK99451.1 transglutaminase [Acidomonas methanolica NBRC 104435]